MKVLLLSITDDFQKGDSFIILWKMEDRVIVGIHTTEKVPLLSAQPTSLFIGTVTHLGIQETYPCVSIGWDDGNACLIKIMAEEVEARGGKPMVCLIPRNKQSWNLVLYVCLQPGNEVCMRKIIPDKALRSAFSRDVDRIVFSVSLKIPASAAESFCKSVRQYGFFVLQVEDRGESDCSQYLLHKVERSLPQILVDTFAPAP